MPAPIAFGDKRKQDQPVTRTAMTFGLAGLALVGLGCGPFEQAPNDPPEPEPIVACCEHYDQAQFADLIGTGTVTTGHDEIDLPGDGYQVRVEAVAVSQGVRSGPAKSAGLGDNLPMPKKPDATHEILSVLLSVTAVTPRRSVSHGYVYWNATATVAAIDDPDMGSMGVRLIDREGQEQKPRGTSTVVVMALVPKDSTVVLCADFETTGAPWLNLRTGRHEQKTEADHHCGHHGPQPWETLDPSPTATR